MTRIDGMINGVRHFPLTAFALGALMALPLGGCRGNTQGDDGAAAAASNIPRAAPRARGADYPPPSRVGAPIPTPMPAPTLTLPPLPTGEVDDPFAPPPQLDPGNDNFGGGTHL